MDYSGDEIKIN